MEMKRAVSFVLALMMTLSMIPAAAFAEEGGTAPVPHDPPTDLQWGVGYDGDGTLITQPGLFSFHGAEGVRYEYEVCLLMDDGSLDAAGYGGSTKPKNGYVTVDDLPWLHEGLETGNYVFTARALGDGVTSGDSETAVSGVWNYVKPDAALVITDPVLNLEDLTLTWTLEGDESLVDYYEITYYRVLDTGEDDLLTSKKEQSGQAPYEFPVDRLEEAGLYCFTVRAVSRDMTVICSSEEVRSPNAEFDGELPLEKLRAPTELVWNRERYGAIDYDEEHFGYISFKRSDLEQGNYEIEVYRWNETTETSEKVHSLLTRYSSTEEPDYKCTASFETSSPDSGTYYFRVRALGDMINYNSSDWAYSDLWTYTAPEEQLPKLKNLRWEELGESMYMAWDIPEDTSMVYSYEVKIWKAILPGMESKLVGGYNRSGAEVGGMILSNWTTASGGSGWYSFTVRVYSTDITQVRHSEWSMHSEEVWVGSIAEKVNRQLEAVLPEDGEILTDERKQEILAAVQAMDKGELAAAMFNNGDTLDLIERLEKAVEASVTIDVDESMEDTLTRDGVSIVGAGLNSSQPGAEITLDLGPADQEAGVIPAQYNNAVQFSMHLTGAEDADAETAGQQLDVPVRITLAVPRGVNPAFLVILHYDEASGAYEELLYKLYEKGGSWYVTFIVYGFSDFALVEEMSARVAEGGSLYVSLGALDLGLTGTAVCAAYDAQGRMLGLKMVPLSELQGYEVLVLEGDYSSAATVKLFLLNGEHAPWLMAGECAITP